MGGEGKDQISRRDMLKTIAKGVAGVAGSAIVLGVPQESIHAQESSLLRNGRQETSVMTTDVALLNYLSNGSILPEYSRQIISKGHAETKTDPTQAILYGGVDGSHYFSAICRQGEINTDFIANNATQIKEDYDGTPIYPLKHIGYRVNAATNPQTGKQYIEELAGQIKGENVVFTFGTPQEIRDAGHTSYIDAMGYQFAEDDMVLVVGKMDNGQLVTFDGIFTDVSTFY